MSEHLILPVYLDNSALLDLLATMDDGFSYVQNITTDISKTVTTDETKRSASAEIILPILKITLNPSKAVKDEKDKSQQVSQERYHTSGSLLNRLRTNLFSQSVIKKFDGTSTSWKELKTFEFVELRGVFRLNPLYSGLKPLSQILEIFNPLLAKQEVQPGQMNYESINTLIKSMLADIEQNSTQIFVVDLLGENAFRAVVPVFTNYLRDKSGYEIMDREYKVLGKIVRNLPEGNSEKINLLSGTGIGALGEKMISQLANGMSGLQNQGFDLPSQIITKISAPALQIVPIAIYV